MQIIPASFAARLRSEVSETRSSRSHHQVDVMTPSSIASILLPSTSSVSKSLDIELLTENNGLRLVKIGAASPLRRLAIPGDVMLRGAMEIGDLIVAINGKLARHPDDLEALRMDRQMFEICVFDHRTHKTVSWKLNSIDEQNRVASIDETLGGDLS